MLEALLSFLSAQWIWIVAAVPLVGVPSWLARRIVTRRRKRDGVRPEVDPGGGYPNLDEEDPDAWDGTYGLPSVEVPDEIAAEPGTQAEIYPELAVDLDVDLSVGAPEDSAPPPPPRAPAPQPDPAPLAEPGSAGSSPGDGGAGEESDPPSPAAGPERPSGGEGRGGAGGLGAPRHAERPGLGGRGGDFGGSAGGGGYAALGGGAGAGDPPPPRSTPRPTGRPRREAPIPSTLSAEGPRELETGAEAEIRVRVEREAEAEPLAHALPAELAPETPVAIVVTVQGEAVALTDTLVMKTVDPPGAGAPREITFGIRGRAPGMSTVVVYFQQGATLLGMLTLRIRVTGDEAREGSQSASAEAAAPDPHDDAVLRLIVHPPTGEEPFYTYFVTSLALDLYNEKFTSPPFALGAGAAADASLAYARSLYRRIETEVLESWEDAALLDRRLKGVGADMCRQLFPAELIRRLWDRRDELDTVEVNSFEPYMPWEVLRLKHPELDGAAGTDERHLAEYRLVRTLSGRWPASALGRNDWRYVLGDYPNKLYADPTGERRFLTTRLGALGVRATSISPSPGDVLDALAHTDFDVIHMACHGSAELDDIDASALILSDRLTASGTTEAVKLHPTDLAADADLSPRKPLVFLNACQTGRMGPSLTDLGGWPRTLFRAGAGAMVGTSWSVHEKPAVAFAEAFYGALLEGKTLAEAAGDGRGAIKGQGASWLAYTVYGLPSARMKAAEPETDGPTPSPA